MLFAAEWFDARVLAVAAAVWLPVWLWSVWHCPPAQRTVWPAAAWLALLPLVQANVAAGAGVPVFACHLLGLNLACLMVGARRACALGGAVLLAHGVAAAGADYATVFPLNALCTVLPACAVNVLLRRVVGRRLPEHVFVYIFVYGFLAAAAGMLLTGVCTVAAWRLLAGLPDIPAHLPVFILLAWGEAFLTGLLTAVLVSFRPQWLGTFRDEVYLRPRAKRIWKD